MYLTVVGRTTCITARVTHSNKLPVAAMLIVPACRSALMTYLHRLRHQSTRMKRFCQVGRLHSGTCRSTQWWLEQEQARQSRRRQPRLLHWRATRAFCRPRLMSLKKRVALGAGWDRCCVLYGIKLLHYHQQCWSVISWKWVARYAWTLNSILLGEAFAFHVVLIWEDVRVLMNTGMWRWDNKTIWIVQ